MQRMLGLFGLLTKIEFNIAGYWPFCFFCLFCFLLFIDQL